MEIFRATLLFLVLAEMSCSSASSSRSHDSPSPSSSTTQVPGLKKIGDVPTGKGPQGIFCVDMEHCWLQQGRNLFRSVNGGQSWDLVNVTGDGEPPRRFTFYSQDAGWATSLSKIYETEDGGKTWEKKSSPFEGRGEITTAYVFNDLGRLWLTGGLYRRQTKEELKLGVPNNARFDRSVIEEAIFRTDDHGKTWQRQSLSPQLIGRIIDVRFAD